MNGEASSAIVSSMMSLWQRARSQRRWVDSQYQRATEMATGYRPDYDDFADDSPKIVLPYAEELMRSVASNIKNAMRGTTPYPELICESNDRNMTAAVHALNKVLVYEMNQANWLRHLKPAVYRALMSGYCASRIIWEDRDVTIGNNEVLRVGGLCIENIEPSYFWFDPSGRSEFYVERRIIHHHELKQNAKAWGYKNIGEVQEGAPLEGYDDIAFDTLENLESNSDMSNDMVELLYFCGSLYDAYGKQLCKNGELVIANRTTLIKEPSEYKTLNGESPYVIMNPLGLTGSGYPNAFIWNMMDIYDGASDLFNLALKHAYMSLPIFGFYGGNIRTDPEEIIDGIYPGASVEVSRAPVEDTIKIFSSNTNPYNVMQVFSLVLQQLQERNAGIVSAGVPSGRGRQSATEVQAAQNLANGLIADLLDGIGESWVTPIAQKALYLIAQQRKSVDDWQDERWKWLLGQDNYEPFMQVIKDNKLLELLNMTTIRVSEPVEVIRRRTTAENLFTMYKIFTANGAGFVDMPEMMKEISKRLGEDPQRYISNEVNWDRVAMSLAGNGLLGQIDEMNRMREGEGGAAESPMPQNMNVGVEAYNQPGPRNPGY